MNGCGHMIRICLYGQGLLTKHWISRYAPVSDEKGNIRIHVDFMWYDIGRKINLVSSQSGIVYNRFTGLSNTLISVSFDTLS